MTVALRLEHVSKHFRIPLDRSTSLKYRMVHWSSASRYADFFALHDVDFEVPYGQFLGVIGHNGSGKSTLLKILSRIYPPSSGAVEINGPVSPFLELGVGFNPELSAQENVFLNGAILGITRGEMDSRVEGILAFAGVADRADQKIKNFSSGMQVRLAFSVAIQANAGILLMDEVLAVGDGEFQAKCLDIFAEYRRSGRTVVLVTHDLSSVDQYCDRAILLDHGRVLADGPASEVTAIYRRSIGQLTDADRGSVATEAGRWGTGEASITAVRLLDGDGHPHRSFTSGQTLRVEVDYQVRQPADGVVCVLGVYRAEGGPLLSEATSQRDGIDAPVPLPGDVATSSYTVPRLALLGGTYRLSVSLRPRHAQNPYDHMEQAIEFRVIDEGSAAGVFDLAGSWESRQRTPSPDVPVVGRHRLA